MTGDFRLFDLMDEGDPPITGEGFARWRFAIRREQFRWRTGERCVFCKEWIGHQGGGVPGIPACTLIPLGVPLEEVRPNCFTVRRYWIGDAIRAACAT